MAVVSTAEDLIAHATARETTLVILDMNLSGINPRQVVNELRELTKECPILAHAPHVHQGKLNVARDAGCDQVLTQGGFHREIAGILDRL